MSAYLYKVIFLPSGQYYIGCRSCKQHPDNDLWRRYFTSSKLIKKLIKKFGANSFEYKVWKIFETYEEAKNYEQKLLMKIDAENNSKLLNQANSTFSRNFKLKWITDGEIDTMINKSKPIPQGFRPGRSQNNKNRIYTESSSKGKIHIIDLSTNDQMMIFPEEFDPKKHIAANHKHNQNRIWIHDPKTHETRIIPSENTIPEGWVKGNPSRKKSSWYHDPKTQKNYQIKHGESIPNNLLKGRYYPWRWHIHPISKKVILCKPEEKPNGFLRKSPTCVIEMQMPSVMRGKFREDHSLKQELLQLFSTMKGHG